MKAPSDTDPVKRLTEDVQLRTPGVSAQRREHDVGTPLDPAHFALIGFERATSGATCSSMPKKRSPKASPIDSPSRESLARSMGSMMSQGAREPDASRLRVVGQLDLGTVQSSMPVAVAGGPGSVSHAASRSWAEHFVQRPASAACCVEGATEPVSGVDAQPMTRHATRASIASAFTPGAE